MNYEELIETLSAIIDNEKFYKTGLTLVYELTPKNHKQMNEQLFYKSNNVTETFIPEDEFEVEINGILVKFIKQKVSED